MKRLFILPFVLMLTIASCQKNNELPNPEPINLNAKALEIIQADNQFGLDLFKQLADTGYAENNIMISPLSVSQALCMAYNGADGETKTAFEETLHFTDMTMEDVNQSAQNLTKALLSVDPKVTLNIANSIWYKDNFAVENDFIERNQTFYDAVVKPVDFNSSQTVNKINNWVDDKTNGKIDKIIDQLSPLDRMILINAIYFKGEWRNQFKKEKTETDQFHLETWGTVDVPMMHTTGNYPYFENEILDALEMSYGRGNFSMVVLLPKEGYRVNDILDTLSAEVWKSWEDQFYVSNDVPVLFPKFKFKYESSLVKVLSALGLSVAFDADADFSGINKNTDLHISEVMHKTFIQVDEEGTEAAAVTSVTIGTTSVGPGMPFVADHPFVFMIKEKYTHAILFIGVMANPEIGN